MTRSCEAAPAEALGVKCLARRKKTNQQTDHTYNPVTNTFTLHGAPTSSGDFQALLSLNTKLMSSGDAPLTYTSYL